MRENEQLERGGGRGKERKTNTNQVLSPLFHQSAFSSDKMFLSVLKDVPLSLVPGLSLSLYFFSLPLSLSVFFSLSPSLSFFFLSLSFLSLSL